MIFLFLSQVCTFFQNAHTYNTTHSPKGNNFFLCFLRFFVHISQFEILFHIMELLPFKFLCKICIQIFDLNSLLLHRITVTDSHCSVCLRLEIVSNTEWGSDLILSSVTFSDISSVVKLTVIFLSKLCLYFLSALI